MFLYEHSLLEQNNETIKEKAEILLSGDELVITILEKSENSEELYNPKAESRLYLTGSRYTSYYFALVTKFNETKGRFIKVHPFTAASKAPMQVFEEFLVGSHVSVFFQIDIGNFAEGDEKIAIKTLRIPSNYIELNGFTSCNLVRYEEQIATPRKVVWDRYALQIGDQVAGCDSTGLLLMGAVIEVPPPAEYLEVVINKYTPDFQIPLVRDVDNEVVFIESTAGVLNTSRVSLLNGTGSFRLYPLGYKGKLKLKLGWKYFSGWSEYEITIKEQL